jgi:anti-anti-sigma factor
LNFRKEVIDDILVVTVSLSKATINITDLLKNLLMDEILKGNNQIVVNLEKVEFTDSSFLGALLAGHKVALEKEGGISLCHLSPQVKNVFEVTYMNRIFKIFDSVDKAIANFKIINNIKLTGNQE